jgi:2-dehydro-3-deoxy-D-gluconate 5-dehydrogenase
VSSRFQGKVIIVTGSGRGIGAAIVQAFVNEGATVIGVARTAGMLTADHYHPINFDLATANPAEFSTLVDSVLTKHGPIAALINNAGIIRRSPAVDFTPADWADVIQVNLTAPFFLAQAVAKWWINGGGQTKSARRLKIVNTASLLSFQGGITVPSYCASKHGIAGVTKALANEWASQRINVNAVAPGYVETENTAALRADPVRNPAILSRIPQGAWAKSDQMAGAYLFLASDDADYVNGAILNVDGGWLAR